MNGARRGRDRISNSVAPATNNPRQMLTAIRLSMASRINHRRGDHRQLADRHGIHDAYPSVPKTSLAERNEDELQTDCDDHRCDLDAREAPGLSGRHNRMAKEQIDIHQQKHWRNARRTSPAGPNFR